MAILSERASRAWTRRFRAILPGLLACWLCAAAVARATDAPPPVSTQELCLLLRSGYTGAEVLRDTAGRPLLEPLDAGAEKLLRDAGADPALVEKLRAGRALASAAQVRAEREHQEGIARQRTENWEINQERLLETSRAMLEASFAARRQDALQSMARTLRGKLIVWRDQRVQTYDDRLLPERRQFAFYFAALADTASRKFTPQLIKFYEQYAPAHPEFELVFISKDVSSMEMESHLRLGPMPWPALSYSSEGEEKELVSFGSGLLPRLMVTDGAGRLLMDSYVDTRYVGPQHVLDELKQRAEAAATAGSSTVAAGR